MGLRKRVEHTLEITVDPANGRQKLWLDGEDISDECNALTVEWNPRETGNKVIATITRTVLVDRISLEGVDVNRETEEVEAATLSVPTSTPIDFKDALTGRTWSINYDEECNGKCVGADGAPEIIDLECKRHMDTTQDKEN